MQNVTRLPERQAEPEKITINLGHVDLGRIDLLVREGFYANRTDFIRTAIRNQLTNEGRSVAQSIDRYQLELGLFDITRADLEAKYRDLAGPVLAATELDRLRNIIFDGTELPDAVTRTPSE